LRIERELKLFTDMMAFLGGCGVGCRLNLIV